MKKLKYKFCGRGNVGGARKMYLESGLSPQVISEYLKGVKKKPRMEKLLDNILKYGTYAILGVYAMFKICPIEEALFGIALSPSLFASVKNTFSAIPDISVANVSDGRLKKWHDANKCDNVIKQTRKLIKQQWEN